MQLHASRYYTFKPATNISSQSPYEYIFFFCLFGSYVNYTSKRKKSKEKMLIRIQRKSKKKKERRSCNDVRLSVVVASFNNTSFNVMKCVKAWVVVGLCVCVLLISKLFAHQTILIETTYGYHIIHLYIPYRHTTCRQFIFTYYNVC